MTLYLGTTTTAARCGYKSNGASKSPNPSSVSPYAPPRCNPFIEDLKAFAAFIFFLAVVFIGLIVGAA